MPCTIPFRITTADGPAVSREERPLLSEKVPTTASVLARAVLSTGTKIARIAIRHVWKQGMVAWSSASAREGMILIAERDAYGLYETGIYKLNPDEL